MVHLIDRLVPYTMFGLTLLPGVPLIIAGVIAIAKRRRIGWFLAAAGAILIAILPLTWLYLLVILVCTGRSGVWIC